MFLLLCLATPALSQKTSSFPSENVTLAEDLIEKGATNTAYFILKHELKSQSLTKNESYSVLKLIARCFLKELDMPQYDEYNRKAYEVMRNVDEIYKAQYYIEKAYMFNHLSWPDSVRYYAYEAQKIIERSKKKWDKIEVPLYYKIIGLSYVYIDNKPEYEHMKGIYGMDYKWKQLFKYYDSSVLIQKKYPYKHFSDISLIYRGYGNRYLDLVSGYQCYTSTNRIKISRLGWYSFYKAIKYYHLANKYLLKSNNIERVTNYSLLGLSYMCIGKVYTAQKYFDTMHKIYELKGNIAVSAPKLYLNALTYERFNFFNLKYNASENQKAINRLEKLIPQWVEYIKSSKGYIYDIYSTSPYFQLFCYYTRKYFHSKKQIDAIRAVEYLLLEKNHFLKIKKMNGNIDSFRKLSSLYELKKLDKKTRKKVNDIISISYHDLSYKKRGAPCIDIKSIMNKLKMNEGIFLSYRLNKFFDQYRILITKNRVSFIKSEHDNDIVDAPEYKTIGFKEFKKWAYKQYLLKLYPLFSFKPDLKKVYTLFDDDTNFDIMISKNKGSTYSELHYVIKNHEFVKVYNIENFFNKPPCNASRLTYMKLKNSDSTKLYFMENFNPNKILKSNKFQTYTTENFRKEFSKPGILHIVGHGIKYGFLDSEFKNKNALVIYKKNKVETIKTLDYNDEIKSDLVILGNCYSGLRVSAFWVYDIGIYLQLLNKGAGNIIANKDQVDDYVSFKIFKYFYMNLKKGYNVPDALIRAKRKFIIENKNGYASPQYWDPFFSISNRRVVF